LGSIQEEIIFLECGAGEWDSFEYKRPNIKCIPVQNISRLSGIIQQGKFFIGNLSAPFALASALDVPRLCELDADPAPFEMDERNYSGNLSWFLNEELKHISHSSIINL
jgi:hypothetical protein